MWSISNFVKASGFSDIDIFYSGRHGFLIPLEEAGKVTKEITSWCAENTNVLFLIECYFHCGGHWDSNFCTTEDLQQLLEADWIDDDAPLKTDAQLFIERGGRHHNCRSEGIERLHVPMHGYIYVVQAPSMDPTVYKIGREKKKFSRIDTLDVKLPWDLDIAAHIESDDYVALENELHERFSEKRIKGEWFQLDDADVEYLKELSNG